MSISVLPSNYPTICFISMVFPTLREPKIITILFGFRLLLIFCCKSLLTSIIIIVCYIFDNKDKKSFLTDGIYIKKVTMLTILFIVKRLSLTFVVCKKWNVCVSIACLGIAFLVSYPLCRPLKIQNPCNQLDYKDFIFCGDYRTRTGHLDTASVAL